MKLVYIAGPYRAKTAFQIEENVRRAEKIALQIAMRGASYICPHANSRFFHGQLTEKFWIDATMELLRRCDAVFMLRGYEASTGSMNEKAESIRLGLPVFEELCELEGWILGDVDLRPEG